VLVNTMYVLRYLACESFKVTRGVDSALFTVGPSERAKTCHNMPSNLSTQQRST